MERAGGIGMEIMRWDEHRFIYTQSLQLLSHAIEYL
jgi:hypothetical protein